MRKAKTAAADELRSEYKRSNFGALVRGKYTEELRASSNVVVIAPEVAERPVLRPWRGLTSADSRQTCPGCLPFGLARRSTLIVPDIPRAAVESLS